MRRAGMRAAILSGGPGLSGLGDCARSLWPVVLACAVGLAAGAAVALGAVWSLVALVALILAFAVVKRPELGLLGILVATSTVVMESSLPQIRLGPLGSFHIPDVVLLSLLGLVVVRSLVEPQFKIVRTPLDWLLLTFYATLVLSTVSALFQSNLSLEDARRALRTVTYFLTFFIVTNLVQKERQLRLLLRGLLLLAVVVALAMAAQFLIGNSLPFLPGRVETLDTAGTSFGGVTRILPPGQSLILVLFLGTTVTLALQGFERTRLPLLGLWSLLGLAVVLTFNRSYWAIVALLLLFLFWIIGKGNRQKLLALALVALLFLALALLPSLIVSTGRTITFMQASVGRFASLLDPGTANEGSLQWRYVETDYAVAQIAAHPLLGLGLGAQYRPFDSRLDYVGQDWDARGYIHNGHLWIMLAGGLIGYGLYVLLALVYLVRGLTRWREVRDAEFQSAVLGFALTFLGLQFTAIVNPIFMQWFWVPLIGIMVGANESIFKLNEQGRSLATTRENP